MGRFLKNNQVVLCGELTGEFQFDHEVYGEKMYTNFLNIYRISGVSDKVPITVSERIIDTEMKWEGQALKIYGSLRSFNKHDEYGHKLILSVFVDNAEVIPFDDFNFDYENKILLEGFICKETNYRKTPFGREICDVLVAVNRSYGKSDYIPCIAWGRNAVFANDFEIGQKIRIEGRIQSREYRKRIGEDEFETKTAFEVSCQTIQKIGEDDYE